MRAPKQPAHPDSIGAGDGGGDGHGAARRPARSAASAVLIVLTCLLVPVALLTVWVHDIVLDTDRYVSTVAPLARDAAVQDAVVHRVTEAVDVRVDGKQAAADISDWLRSQGLPPRAAGAVRLLGPQLDAAVNSAVTRIAQRFVRSEAFARLWTQANRTGHQGVVHALTGEGRGAVGVSGGTVTLDVGTVVDEAKQRLVDAGLSPASKIPSVNKQLVLFQSDQLKKARSLAHLLDVLGNWLPVVVVLIGAGGVLLARRRRRALARTALGAAFACLVVAIALVVARRYLLDHLPPQVQSPAAAAVIFDTLVRFLRSALRTAIVLGVIVALGAYLIGPGRLPVAARGLSERTADSAASWAYAHEIRTGRAGVWTERNRHWIALGALLVVSLVFALWNHPTVATVVVLVLVLLVLLALLALLAASGRVTGAAAADGPDAGTGRDRKPGEP
ncbi:hypothetical protein [Streptomyces sp. NPDC047000]|uniref:hypothetical protein n=1 Tax=Streptomyces sp. NPDC047000 TaxID=3155474 RepID=UPI0033F7144B